uniref:glycosyltransferase n=2 Tax=Treponema pedis TaxID=409322 RepID=UPI0004647455
PQQQQQQLKVLLVLDQYDNENNGTTITARRLAEGLKKVGCDVRIVSTGKEQDNKFIVKSLNFPPIIENIIRSQGMQFAAADKDVLYRAINWADFVHFIMPFWLSIEGVKIAKELKKPHTAAFHVQPQNITYSIGCGRAKWPNEILYSVMKNYFYKYFRHIHCPSQFIANQLKQHKYDAKLHIISNGVDNNFTYIKNKKPDELKEKIVILMIGRLSKEKRQDVLINAVYKSKYTNKIQLIFAGNGPLKNKYKKLSKNLKYAPIFGFYSQKELIHVISYSDLYVHTADVEIEAISCIEAFSCGLVPIIANSVQSATSQFALDERSLFTSGNYIELSKKIDYWLDNPNELFKQGCAYAEYGKKFMHSVCVQKMLLMFKEEMEDFKALDLD